MATHFHVLVVGGGNAGLSATAQLLHKDPSVQIGIIEPSAKHYYQPAWTLVGAGQFDVKDTEKNEQNYIPEGADWIRDAVATFQPDQNQVTCLSGATYTYDALMVVPGIQLDWGKIKGFTETLGKNKVSSNYSFQTAPYTWELIRNFKGGVAVFTNPATPVKCGGAPHKIMYLACDYWRKNGVLDKTDVHYVSGAGAIFAVKEFAQTLEGLLKRYRIKTHFSQNVTEVDGLNQTIYFEGKDADGNVQKQSIQFDMAHITPPQSAPDFIKNSPLADPAQPLGWVEVNKFTFQHSRFPNIFACGDVSNAPTSKTGAAIRKQAPVMVEHILAYLHKTQSSAQYDGYTACPIPTEYGKLMLAEFDYSNKPKMTFPFDQAVPCWTMWLLKKYLLPWLYWHRILTGKA
ncbi:FAD/NAD(P)-binding oxidoreductase [Spirosoma sp.]|uniref:NAD(P)/FAD-dependent oxidoreductase n=1 Tax=Spirosoma sp. TaxID=1899569 RepID=UPI00260C761F|nr:FAD/NAD(P)-binding oxidoreductase [Spirosoma sp.]MCX6216795.1 FAD/NAD(P)-binding oxidoreductase [Spirosoma sp.]